MGTGQLTVAVVNGLAASTLVVAAMGKLVSGRQLLAALRELLGPYSSLFTTRAVQVIALVELVAASCLLVPQAKALGLVLVTGLGMCFAGAGLAGWLGHSKVACGCFGARHGRPLGPLNFCVGLALASVLLWNGLLGGVVSIEDEYAVVASLTAALGAVVLSLWLHRRLILVLLRPARPVLDRSASM